MLNHKLVFLALCLGACAGPSSLATATSPVGDPCPGPSTGIVAFTAGGLPDGPSYGALDTTIMQIVLGGDAQRLGCTGVASSGARFFAPPQLGDHVVDGVATRFSTGGSGNDATGTISIDGYDPGSGLLCGALHVVSGGHTIVGTFSAQMGCP